MANKARNRKDVAFFEAGPCFTSSKPGDQHKVIAGVRKGFYTKRNPYEPARLVDFIDIKADFYELMEVFSCPVAKIRLERTSPTSFHPGCSASVYLVKNVIGYFGMLHPALCHHYSMEDPVYAFEFNVDSIISLQSKKAPNYTPHISHDLQTLHRDFAFVVDKEMEVEKISKTIMNVNKELITEVHLFDIYEGLNIGENRKSLAYSVTIQPTNHSLNETEITALCATIEKAVIKNCKGVLRTS